MPSTATRHLKISHMYLELLDNIVGDEEYSFKVSPEEEKNSKMGQKDR